MAKFATFEIAFEPSAWVLLEKPKAKNATDAALLRIKSLRELCVCLFICRFIYCSYLI